MPTLALRRRRRRDGIHVPSAPRKGDEKDGMGSKPLGGFTAAICMIKDGGRGKGMAVASPLLFYLPLLY